MKITSTLEWSLLAAATIFNGILAGGSLIKSVVELPARRTIGLPAMAAYHRAADLRTGFWIYPSSWHWRPSLLSPNERNGPSDGSSERRTKVDVRQEVGGGIRRPVVASDGPLCAVAM